MKPYLKKHLFIFGIFTVAIVIVLILYFAIRSHLDLNSSDDIEEWEDEKRSSTSSSHIVNMFKSRMIPSVDPCESIYNFACGSKTSKVLMAKEVYEKNRKELIRQLDIEDFEGPEVFWTSKKFFSICKSYEPKKEEFKTLKELFETLGGFPTLEGSDWSDADWSWLETTRKIRDRGLFTDSLFVSVLGYHPLDLRNLTFHIKNPELTVFINEECFTYIGCEVGYVSKFVRVVMEFGVDRPTAIEDGSKLFHFERNLYLNVQDDLPGNTAATVIDQLRTLSNLSSSWDFIQWPKFLKAVSGKDENLPNDLEVVVENPTYISGLRSVFENTPKRLLANFMMWSILFRLAPDTNKSDEECFQILQTPMSYALQSMYVSEHHDTNYLGVITEVANMIKEEFVNTIQTSNWASDEMKDKASTKVKEISYKLGYPRELLNATFIDNYYKNLTIDGGFFQSFLQIQKFFADKCSRLCCRRQSDLFWDLSFDVYLPTISYDMAQNCLHFTQGVFTDPLFNSEWPVYTSFGRLGSVIGHEMAHALDSIGLQYDSEGRRKSAMDEPFFTLFNNRSQCFVEHYNEFVALEEGYLKKHRRLSGDFKVVENVADSIGVALAFRAYKNYKASKNLTEISFKGLDFSGEQMLFLSFAQYYCIDYAPDEYFPVYLEDHAHNPYRTTGPLQNLREYGEVFKCNNGSRMNPEHKCKIW